MAEFHVLAAGGLSGASGLLAVGLTASAVGVIIARSNPAPLQADSAAPAKANQQCHDSISVAR